MDLVDRGHEGVEDVWVEVLAALLDQALGHACRRDRAANPEDAAGQPGEALALLWSDVMQATLLVQRGLPFGDDEHDADEDAGTKTDTPRSVTWTETASQLAQAPLEARARNGRTDEHGLVRLRGDRAPYVCRHSFVSLSLRAGMDQDDLARQSGHSVDMQQRIYRHLIEEFKARRQVAKISPDEIPSARELVEAPRREAARAARAARARKPAREHAA